MTNLSFSDASTEVTYAIDAADRIVAVGGGWDGFAAANDAADLAERPPLGRTLWQSISDMTLVELYRQLVGLVRKDGRERVVECRCDGPDRIRRISIRVAPGPDPAGVAFTSKVVEELPRPHQPLLDRRSERDGEQLKMCSWCARLLVGETWTPLDEAVARLGLLERVPPPVSHGMCPDCASRVRRELLAG